MRSLNSCGILLALIGASWAGLSSAQSYPTKPIRIHTTGAGGSVDFASRLVAPELGTALGQPIVVENKPNNSLAVGVAKSAPDGYTLLLWGPGMWIGPLFEDAPAYDAVRDFSTISMVSRSPNMVIITPSLPVKTVADLISYAKSRPGQLNYATGATGSSNHIGGELFKAMSGTNIVRVTYKGGASEITDIMSGQVHMTFGTGATFGPHIKTGKVRALATTGTQRFSLFPDLPTVADTLPGYVSESMLGLFAPAKTPDAIIRRLNQESVRVLARPDVREKFLSVGQEASGGTPEQFATAVQAEIDRVNKLIKDGAVKRGE